jgi:5-methylcytosine-specific restriction endonuclease McrA
MIRGGVLVLNRSWQPVNITSVKRAFCLLFADQARAIDAKSYRTFDWQAWLRRCTLEALGPGGGPLDDARDWVGTVTRRIRIPRIILLTGFDRVPRSRVRFNRYNVFTRDRYTCQYCGRRAARAELNIDHVLPRCQGGRSTWENVVCACRECNRRKGARTPEQAGMPLLRAPRRPLWSPLWRGGDAARRHDEWSPFLGRAELGVWGDDSEAAS